MDLKRTHRLFFVIVMMVAWGSFARGQSSTSARHWVFLRDRVSATHVTAASLGITERSMARRAKVLPADRRIDQYDLPPTDQALMSIRATGATVHIVSRWLNAVSVEATPIQLSAIQALPDVVDVRAVAVSRRAEPEPTLGPAALARSAAVTGFDYGGALTQVSTMHVPELHDLGILGTGVLIGMLDDGFNNHRTHEALSGIRVVAEYDFVQSDSNTSRAPGEYASQGNHGAGTLSAIGAFLPGKMIGTAPGASFVLAKTEVDSVEIHAEEDNYVAGLEWMERLGVDIASASLAYGIFDPPAYSYFWHHMDGKTSIVARAVSIAARKGVLVCNAMGNEGQTYVDSGTGMTLHVDTTLTSPADADSMVAVGAASSSEVLARFSGTGPTADGRIKPEVVAQGVGVYWVNGSSTNGYVSGVNGTSCSTPLVAGAAALILSTHPELTPMQVRQALMATAHQVDDGTPQTSSYPNNFYGSGFVRALDAALYHGPIASNTPTVSTSGATTFITIHVRSNAVLIPDSLRLYYHSRTATTFAFVPLVPTGNPYEYAASVPSAALDSGSVGYFAFADNAGHSRRLPSNAPDSLLVLSTSPAPLPQTVQLHANYPNPFNNGTTIVADIPSPSQADVVIYNMLGERVRTLFSGQAQPPALVLHWDGKDDGGHAASTGVYLYRLKAGSQFFVRKMLLLK
jgi:serine protease AprX